MSKRNSALQKAGIAAAILAVASLAGCPTNTEPDSLPEPAGEHWLRFVHLSDTQIVDDESPARLVRFTSVTRSAWRPQEAYGVQTLDATLRVVNARAGDKGDFPIDFLIATGDLTDGCQHNELRWFIDTMDGQAVLADSGDPDGAMRLQAAEDNPKLLYQTEGLDPAIPWYSVFGNHDGLAVGTFGINRDDSDFLLWTSPLLQPVATLIGLHLFYPPTNALSPVSDKSPAAILGSLETADPDTLDLDLTLVSPGPIVPDDARRFSSRLDFVLEHFNTVTAPAGHGFAKQNIDDGTARYAFRPVADVPIRVVVLDTVAPEPLAGFPAHYGVMTVEQFRQFLVPQIQAASDAGEYVIIASHHPSADFDIPYPAPVISAKRFREFLASQSNVIAHICGHTHRNFVQRIDGPFPYYEIETGSIIDYPQEARILDIYVDNQSKTVRITGQMLSHMENPTQLSAESFRRAEVHAEKSIDLKNADAIAAAFSEDAITAWPQPMPSKTESYGSASDRDFDLVLQR